MQRFLHKTVVSQAKICQSAGPDLQGYSLVSVEVFGTVSLYVSVGVLLKLILQFKDVSFV